mgnify:CR=1 FL=1
MFFIITKGARNVSELSWEQVRRCLLAGSSLACVGGSPCQFPIAQTLLPSCARFACHDQAPHAACPSTSPRPSLHHWPKHLPPTPPTGSLDCRRRRRWGRRAVSHRRHPAAQALCQGHGEVSGRCLPRWLGSAAALKTCPRKSWLLCAHAHTASALPRARPHARALTNT